MPAPTVLFIDNPFDQWSSYLASGVRDAHLFDIASSHTTHFPLNTAYSLSRLAGNGKVFWVGHGLYNSRKQTSDLSCCRVGHDSYHTMDYGGFADLLLSSIKPFPRTIYLLSCHAGWTALRKVADAIQTCDRFQSKNNSIKIVAPQTSLPKVSNAVIINSGGAAGWPMAKRKKVVDVSKGHQTYYLE